MDKKIKEEGHYDLKNLSNSEKIELFDKTKTHGTRIIFENIRTKLNSEEIIRKYLATQFNFIFSSQKDDSFEIIVNGKKISQSDLKELDGHTQFIWFFGKEDKERKKRYKNLDKDKIINDTSFKFEGKVIEIKGFMASVIAPSHLLLRGSSGDFKAGINLFCNGRLRQENLFQEITSKRIAEEYLYGEIHVDGFEDEEVDRFTSSREGIIQDDPLYQAFLRELRKIQNIILADWSPWRVENKNEGDLEDGLKPKYEKRLEDSKNWREKDFESKINENIEDQATKKSLKEKLRALSYKNVLIYQDLFILENIFREYIKLKNIEEKYFDTKIDEEKDIVDRIKNTRGLRQKDEERHALKGKIVKEEHYLNYTDLYDLSEIIDLYLKKNEKKITPKKYRKELSSDAKEINPVRNPIMHTNEITDGVLKWGKIKNLINYIEKLKDKK